MLSQKIQQIYLALRGLFKDKSELKGVDDWDTLIGILMALEQVGAELQQMEAEKEE